MIFVSEAQINSNIKVMHRIDLANTNRNKEMTTNQNLQEKTLTSIYDHNSIVHTENQFIFADTTYVI